MKLDKALSLLQALADELPEGKIEAKYGKIYQSILSDIESETGLDLSYFSVPLTEFNPYVTGASSNYYTGESRVSYSAGRYCPRARFLIGLKGAINFLNSQTQQTGRRVIGFTQAT